MKTIQLENLQFEIVESIPKGYEIWNIGINMIDGFLPICETDGCNVNVDTLKAIKCEQAQVILSAVRRGQKTIKQMETYIKRYSNSEKASTKRHVQKLRDALEVMYTIKWD